MGHRVYQDLGDLREVCGGEAESETHPMGHRVYRYLGDLREVCGGGRQRVRYSLWATGSTEILGT